jgi:hypothetical protein
MLPQHTGSKASALRPSEELVVAGYIPQSVATLWEADVDTNKDGKAMILKPVVLPRPSSIGSAKGRSHWGFSTGLSVHKALLLMVVLLHGS